MTEQQMTMLIADTLEGRGVGDIQRGGAAARPWHLGWFGLIITAEDGTRFFVRVEDCTEE